MTETAPDIDCIENMEARHAWVGLDRVKRLWGKDMVWCARRLAPRQHAFMQGDDQKLVYRVKNGYLRLYATLNDGRRQIIGFKSAGDFLTPEMGAKHRYSAQAISTAEVQSIGTADFYAAVNAAPDLLLKLYRMVCADLSQAHDLVIMMGKRDAEESLAAFLLGMEARAPAPGGKTSFITLPMLHGDVADYLGLTSETVSRIFTQFKKRGLIEVRGRHGIRLANRRALRGLAERRGGKRAG